MVVTEDKVVELPLDKIIRGDNDRSLEAFDQDSLTELAASIRDNGLAQPGLVRPLDNGLYQIVAGERRNRASWIYTEKVTSGEWDESPRYKPGFYRCIVRQMTDEEASAFMLLENDQREDLNPIDRARAYRKRQDEYGWSIQTLADKVHKTVRYVESFLCLLDLDENVQELVKTEVVPLSHARLMTRLDSVRQQQALVLLGKGKRVTYAMFRGYVDKLIEEQSQQSMFDLTNFWIEQVNEAEETRKGIQYDLPTSNDLPKVRIEKRDNTSRVIRRYIDDLMDAGLAVEAETVGTLMMALLNSRLIKS